MINVVNYNALSGNVESLVASANMSYLDAVLHYCEMANLEVETAAKLISNNSALYSQLEIEGEQLNFLPKKSRLPL